MDRPRELFAMVRGTMAIVPLITRSNVACPLLIRSVARRDEVAARRVRGAGRRILQQHVTEGVMLWLLGGTAGALLAVMLTRAIAPQRLAAAGMSDVSITSDWRVIAFGAALPLTVGLIFSVLPALRVMRIEVIVGLAGSYGLALA